MEGTDWRGFRPEIAGVHTGIRLVAITSYNVWHACTYLQHGVYTLIMTRSGQVHGFLSVACLV